MINSNLVIAVVNEILHINQIEQTFDVELTQINNMQLFRVLFEGENRKDYFYINKHDSLEYIQEMIIKTHENVIS